MTKPRISVEITEAQQDRLSKDVKDSGKSVSDYVRDRLFPETEIVREGHHVLVGTDKPLAPNFVPSGQTKPEQEAHGPSHPCLSWNPRIAPNFTALDSVGTCVHPSQKGKPCHWRPIVAFNCPKYEPLTTIRSRGRTL